MKHPCLPHVFAPTRYVSPFDINMASEPVCLAYDEAFALARSLVRASVDR